MKIKIFKNKNHKLLRIINFYNSQLKVLDDMLEEVNQKSKNAITVSDHDYFHNEFLNKKKKIEELRQNIVAQDYLLSKELNQNEGLLSEQIFDQNKKLENNVFSFERDVNELSNDFKMYILNKV